MYAAKPAMIMGTGGAEGLWKSAERVYPCALSEDESGLTGRL